LIIKSGWPIIKNVLSEFPELTVIAAGCGPHGQDRVFRPLLERYPNLYIELSTYMLDGGIESLCERYGASRLLFGSGYPKNCSGAALLNIIAAQIENSDKALILSGNLERILERVRI